MSVVQAHPRISQSITIVTILDRLASEYVRPHFRNRLLSYHHRTKAVRRPDAVTNRCDRWFPTPLRSRAEYCRIYLLSPSWHLAPPVACRKCEWRPNVRIPQTVHIHNDDDFCKLFTALISVYKFFSFFFPSAQKFWRIFKQKMGEILDIYIFSGVKLWN